MRSIGVLLAACLLALGLPAPRPAAAATVKAVTEEKVTVLSYHEIADAADALIPQYAVSPTMFVRQMDWLRNNGFRFVSIDDVIADKAGRRPDRKSVV